MNMKVAGAASLAAFPMNAIAGTVPHHSRSNSCIDLCDGLNSNIGRKERRQNGGEKNANINLSHCQTSSFLTKPSSFADMDTSTPFTKTNANVNCCITNEKRSEVVNAHDQTKMRDRSLIDLRDAIRRRNTQDCSREITSNDETQPQITQEVPLRPRLVITLDTRTVGVGVEQGSSPRNRIQSRTQKVKDRKRRQSNRGPEVSISFNVSPPSTSPLNNNTYSVLVHNNANRTITKNESQTLVDNLLISTQTAFTLITQTVALLPTLLLSRRALNSTFRAIVDYIRGRTIRKKFTKLERAYLRYYEFPAVTRAIARLVSQIGILLGLSWVVRAWMIFALIGNDGVRKILSSVTWVNVGTDGTNLIDGSREGIFNIGTDWNAGSPCASLCGLVWIGTVVGIGHLLVVAVSS